jgi:hypothetical protein
MPPDTAWGPTYTITEHISVADTQYTLAAHPFALATALRYDSRGKVWARVNDRDKLYLDFTLEEGDSYLFTSSDSYDVVLERKGTIHIGAGTFEEVIELHFKWAGLDGDRRYAFARGVGLVYAYGGGGDYRELYSAQIGDMTVTTNEEVASSTGLQISVYPNPFSSSSSIEVEGGESNVGVEIVDVLGRRVRVLQKAHCRARCYIELQREGLAAGVYYLVVSAGSRRAIRKLVIGG